MLMQIEDMINQDMRPEQIMAQSLVYRQYEVIIRKAFLQNVSKILLRCVKYVSYGISEKAEVESLILIQGYVKNMAKMRYFSHLIIVIAVLLFLMGMKDKESFF